MQSHQRLVSRMGAGRWVLLLALVLTGFAVLRAQSAFAVDDPTKGTFQFNPTTYNVNEGSIVTLTVTRVGGSATQVNVSYSMSKLLDTANGTDYSIFSGSLTFPAGVTTKTLDIPTTQDLNPEANETFTVTITSPDVILACVS